ncbi:RE2 [Symbiodinium sp. CCMP2592]|nr:RE2 [Symbiodinium sp. CCMP2592]
MPDGEGGVEGVLKRLESAASDGVVYGKHHYLRTWESIRRHGGESMRAYVQLGHLGARMVLIASGQSFEWIPIRDSLLLQYPDTLPVPPIAGGQAKGREKGKGKDAKRVHLTEAPDEATGEAAEPQAEDAELEEISKAMEVLTVTAQKLKSFHARTPVDGWEGHWLDLLHWEAPHEGGYEEPPPDEQAYDDQPYDEYYDAAEGQAEEDGQGQETHESYFVWMTTLEEWIPPQVSQVLTNAPETAAGLMIVDTACQKTCIGRKAYLAHCATLRPFGLSCKWLPESVLVASLLAAEIPLLASLKMLKQLGAVLDLPSEKAFLGSLQIEVPLHVTLGGHLAICVTSFPVDGLPCDLDRWHYRRAPTEEVLFGPAKSEQSAASADNHGLSESEALQVRASAEVRPHLEEPPRGADAPELPARSGLGEEHAAGIDPPSNGHRGKLHTSDQRDQPLRERNRQVRPVQGVRYPVEVARRPRWLGLLASVTWAVYSALANADYGCGPEHGPRYEGQSQGNAQGPAFEYPFLGELPTLPSSDPQGTSGVRPVEPRIGDELRAGRLERARVLRLDSDFLKTGQRKRLAGVARKAGAALGLELSTLHAELAKAVNARRKIDYDHDLMQVTPCDSKGNVEALGLKGVEETWDVASHRGRKKFTEALDYYNPLVLAVRLTSSPAHSDPEVSKAALKVTMYWTLIAPPDHTVWSNQNVSRLLSSSHAHVTQAEERVTANHEWLAQPTPEATPAGLAYRVRRVVRELEPTRFRREKQRPLRAPACGTWDRVSTKPPFHETYYLDYVQDDREWRGVMDQVEQVFRTSASPQITLTPGHEIWKRISEMIPWRIERVQLAKAPKARRFPRDIPFTHRATVLLYNDDEVACESDDVANIAFPHQRFPKPVRYAICVYGDAPEDPTDVPAPPQPTGTPPVDPDVPPAEVHGADITFPNCKAPREIQRAVARLHVNLGHPSSADLVRMLAQNGAVTPEAVSAAKALTCASCLRMRGNAPPRPSRLVDRFVGQLGDCVQMDIFYSRTVDGTNYPLLGIVDEATNLQQVCVLKDRNPKTVVEAFRTTWARPFGFPHKVTLDQDGAFMGDFWTYLVDNSTEVDYVPAEAHHRLGKAERCNAVYREVLNRVVDSMAAATPEDLEMAVDATTHAINSMPRSRGLSAYAIVFGRIPRVPAELLTDDSSLAANIPLEEHNRHTIVYRAEAQKAAAQVNVDQHVRRALLRKTAHMRIEDISPGAKCAVWRSQLRGKGPRKRGGYVIGRLVTFDGHCAWVQLGTQTVKVDRNQLRPAYGFEAWSPTDEDIKALKNAEANLLSGEVEDWQGEAPPDDEPLFPELEFPREPSEEQVQSALDGTDGADLAALADTAAASAASAPPLPTPAYSPPASEVPLQDDSEMASQGTKRTVERLSAAPSTPAKRISRLSSQATLICESGEVFLRPPGWDGTDWEPDHRGDLASLPEVFASEHREPPIQGAEDDGVEDCHPSWRVCYVGDQKQLANVNKMTRKEVKALNREIPWREILKQPRVVFDKYVEAARKEHEQWGTWAPVRPLSDKEANEVLKDPLLRTRVLKSRACYRDKACGQGALQAKCRVVVLGHRDPDLHAISRDAPTPTRLTEHILLAVYISGRNRSFLRNRRVWRLWSADATTAFLQGRQNEGERPNRLFMMSPRDPILEKAGAFPATIYEVTGSVYGLANAPRLWSLEVGKRLLAAGFRPHALDRMCFLHYDKEGCLDCIALVYVDDFLVTYADHFDLTVLTRLFKWGKTSFDTDVITFKGKQLRTVKENGVFVLRVTQSEYIRTLAPGKVTRQRGREDPKLTEAELSEFRSVCGALQWLVGQTRPDGAETVSLMNRGNDSTLSELKQLYALSEYFARTHSDGLVFHGIPINEHSIIVSYGDCSWANAQEYKSQEGLLVCLTTPDALTGNAPAVLLDWKSTRTPRVVRSTLAGEAYAADDSIDRGVLANQMFSEIIFGCEANPVTNLKTLRHCHATDCKSLYDAAIAANFNTEEKRVGLTIRAVQETIAPQDMRWVPTTAMWADGLTKVSDSLRETFRNWLRQPTVQLRSDA